MAVAAGAAAGSPAPAEGAVWVEIIPVFRVSTTIWCLRPEGGASWRLPYGGGDEVHRLVRRHLAALGVEPAAVHSTSWRQEAGTVVLTHLAVVARPAGDVAGFERRPVRGRELAFGTALAPPARIDPEHVVAHALRHLAWLVDHDGAVREALGPGWRGALRPHQPEPFRLVEGEPAGQ
jgi:hypothetical protein